jgi:hypothetical protein
VVVVVEVVVVVVVRVVGACVGSVMIDSLLH